MKNKKGISAIVATVLIILITVAAVTIIWAAIIPMIQDNLAGSQECLDASSALTVKSDFSCLRTVAANTCTVTNDGESTIDGDAVCGESTQVVANDAACTAINTADLDCEVSFSAAASNSVDVQVHRGTGNFELVGVEIIIGAGGTTQSKTFDVDDTILSVNGDKVFTILDITETITEAGVAAIVKTGNAEKTCAKGGMAQIDPCL